MGKWNPCLSSHRLCLVMQFEQLGYQQKTHHSRGSFKAFYKMLLRFIIIFIRFLNLYAPSCTEDAFINWKDIRPFICKPSTIQIKSLSQEGLWANPFFLICEISLKSKIKILYKWSDFGGFWSPEVRKTKKKKQKQKIPQISIFGFQSVAIKYTRLIKDLYFMFGL